MDNNNRISKLRKKLGFTQVEFAQKLGFTQSNLSAIELDKIQLTEANINLICLMFGVNELWITTGDGEMFDRSVITDENSKELLSIFTKLSSHGQSTVIGVAEKLHEYESSACSEQE